MKNHWRLAVRICGAGGLALGLFWLYGDLKLTDDGIAYRASALGEHWYKWHAPSLNLLQAIVERYVLPQLWTYVLLPLLLAPAWMVAGIFAAILFALSATPERNSDADQN